MNDGDPVMIIEAMKMETEIRQAEDVAFRVIGDAAVLVTSKEPLVYWLNTVATRVWELADGSRDAAAIAGELCGEFEVEQEQAAEDVEKMVEAFVSKGLLQR